MSFLARTAIRSSSFFTRRTPNPIHRGGPLPFFLRDSPPRKHFSIGSEQEQPPASSDTVSLQPLPPPPSMDPFFQTQTPGGGLVYGKLSNGMTPDDIRKGRMRKLERGDRSDWDIAKPYNGKTVFDDCFDGPVGCVSLIEHYIPFPSLSPPVTASVVSWAPGDMITFSDADLPPDSQNHIRALYVTAELRGVVLSRAIVDNGTNVNMMPRRTFDMLGYNQNDLIPCSLTVEGFNNSTMKPLGKVMTDVKLGILNSEVEFVVMDVPAKSYNLLLGIPWLHDLGAVPSPLHQKVKLPFKMGNLDGILTVEGER